MPEHKQQKTVTRKRGRGGGASSRSGRTPARRRYIQDMAEESSDESHSSSESSSSGDSRYDSSFVNDDDSGCELEDATFYRLLDLAQSEVRAAEGPTVPVHVTSVTAPTSSLIDDILDERNFSPNEAGPEESVVTNVTGPAQASSSANPAPTRRGPGRPPGARNRNPTAASRRRNENATPASPAAPPSTATPGNRGGRSRGAPSTFFESPIPGEEYLPRASAPAYNIPLLKIQPDEIDEVTNSYWPGDEVT